MRVWDGARESLLAAALALAERGFLAGVGGNLALRCDDAHFVVTPSATDYYAMTVDDICVLHLETLAVLAGRRAPSVESGLHARLLRQRPDVDASVHTHQPVASACGLLGQPFAVPPAFRAVLGEVVPVCGYAPSGTAWLAARAARACTPGTRAMLLRNHGVIGLGTGLAEAAEVVVTLEQALREWFRAGLAGHDDILAALAGAPEETVR